MVHVCRVLQSACGGKERREAERLRRTGAHERPAALLRELRRVDSL